MACARLLTVQERPMTHPSDELLKTPLHDLHLALGARMVPFAGYSMPVQYPAGLLAEHHHTRNAASLFAFSDIRQVLAYRIDRRFGCRSGGDINRR